MINQMILAAAIKFHILSTNQEVVLCGRRHHDILNQLEPLGFEPRTGYIEIGQGFITSSGLFLLRKESYQHAKLCGQLAAWIVNEREKYDDEPDLYSEDLW